MCITWLMSKTHLSFIIILLTVFTLVYSSAKTIQHLKVANGKMPANRFWPLTRKINCSDLLSSVGIGNLITTPPRTTHNPCIMNIATIHLTFSIILWLNFLNRLHTTNNWKYFHNYHRMNWAFMYFNVMRNLTRLCPERSCTSNVSAFV